MGSMAEITGQYQRTWMKREIRPEELDSDTNYLWVIEMRTSLKWLPMMPPRVFGSLDVAHIIISDMTGRDYKEVLFCRNPGYRIIEYSSVYTNEILVCNEKNKR